MYTYIYIYTGSWQLEGIQVFRYERRRAFRYACRRAFRYEYRRALRYACQRALRYLYECLGALRHEWPLGARACCCALQPRWVGV